MNALPTEAAIRILTGLLAARTGQEISQSRLWRIETALRPLVREMGLANVTALAEHLVVQQDPAIEARVIDAMLNHETSFFRDVAVFHTIARTILPDLCSRATDRRLRIWSAGCSFGEEPYSIAVMLKELGAQLDGWRISIIATDVSPVAIDRARAGRFSQMEAQRGLSVEQLLRWFQPHGDDWQISPEIRDMVRFQVDNLLEPRHVSGVFDLILCRNVMLYFPERVRAQACANLANHARDGAFLVLGAGETLVGCDSAFTLNPDARCAYQAPLPNALRCAS